jgi:hypothetical protein
MSKVETHDNYISFKKTGITSASYKINAYSITSGQPFNGSTTFVDNDGINIDFNAGRKASYENANWFKQQAIGGNAIATDDIDSWPTELNFASNGNLTLMWEGKTIIVENLIIAQGHNTNDRNNWWIASGKASQLVGANPLLQVLVVPGNIAGVIPEPVMLKFQAVIGDMSHFDMEIMKA